MSPCWLLGVWRACSRRIRGCRRGGSSGNGRAASRSHSAAVCCSPRAQTSKTPGSLTAARSLFRGARSAFSLFPSNKLRGKSTGLAKQLVGSRPPAGGGSPDWLFRSKGRCEPRVPVHPPGKCRWLFCKGKIRRPPIGLVDPWISACRRSRTGPRRDDQCGSVLEAASTPGLPLP